jgi:GTPase
MFIDEVTVEVFGGKGGNGMASYRREKYVEYGGPWGGNGGHGGSVIFVGDEGKNNLIDLRYQRHIRAKNGENGMSKGMHGKNAEHRYIRVPLGTVVYSENKSFFLGEITEDGQKLVVARGGKGGRGNIAFATAKNSAPDYAENGDPGEIRKLHIELKVIADVGLVGYPSVGKSTLISVVSNARPKIAEYHFTTLQPNLGMVYVGEESFVLADLPGLIEDAHQGHGLGIRFLKHIERCKVFLHVLDITREDPYQDYVKINHELEMYDEALLERPQIVVINKIDMPETKEKN